MDLIPAMLGVVDPRADQVDPIADCWRWKMPVIARHQLDDEEAVLLAVVARGQESLLLHRDIEVQVPVLLVVADQGDAAAYAEAGIKNREPFRVIDAS
jgi:hypothetical protein